MIRRTHFRPIAPVLCTMVLLVALSGAQGCRPDRPNGHTDVFGVPNRCALVVRKRRVNTPNSVWLMQINITAVSDLKSSLVVEGSCVTDHTLWILNRGLNSYSAVKRHFMNSELGHSSNFEHGADVGGSWVVGRGGRGGFRATRFYPPPNLDLRFQLLYRVFFLHVYNRSRFLGIPSKWYFHMIVSFIVQCIKD